MVDVPDSDASKARSHFTPLIRTPGQFMRRAIVEISPGQIRLLITSGTHILALGERTIDLPTTLPEGSSAISETFNTATDPLTDLVRESKAAGLPAVIVVHGAGNTLNASSNAQGTGERSGAVVQSCPRKSGTRSARSAALLALDAATSLDFDSSPNAAFAAATDPDRVHAIAFVMADQIVAETRDLALKAGLKFEGSLPGEAVCTTGCLAESLRLEHQHNTPDQTEAFIWIDENAACLCIASSGRLLLSRSISIGLDALVESLSKPIRGADHNMACVRFDRAGARRLLVSRGIPHAADPIDGHPDLTGASLLPLLQPVLQRIAVEIKQTVRFGLAEEHRQGLSLRVVGPAAHVPRLQEVLAALSGLSPSLVAATSADGPHPSAAAIGQIAPHALRPITDQQSTRTRRTRAAALAGTALALAWVGLSAFNDHANTKLHRKDLLLHKASADTARAQLAQSQHAVSIRSAARTLETHIASTIGTSPEWPDVLVWLAANTQPAIRYALIECDSRSDAPALRLAGVAHNTDRAAVNNDISTLLAQLREWPPADRVQLRSAEVHGDAAGCTGTFEIMVTFVSLPNNSALTDLQHPLASVNAPTRAEDNR